MIWVMAILAGRGEYLHITYCVPLIDPMAIDKAGIGTYVNYVKNVLWYWSQAVILHLLNSLRAEKGDSVAGNLNFLEGEAIGEDLLW